MKCPLEDKLVLYLEKELSDKEIDDFEHHLEGCSICKEDMKIFEKIEKDFDSEISVPDDFTGHVMNRIDEQTSIINIIVSAGISMFFLIVFFYCGYSNPLPVIGTIMVRLFFVLKDMPLMELFFACLKQNMMFLIFYSALLMVFITFFTVRKKAIV
ncbi:MAG: zf-HC2 domain-containing protein, partial [Candidatus Eremiobacterota bacterium]